MSCNDGDPVVVEFQCLSPWPLVVSELIVYE